MRVTCKSRIHKLRTQRGLTQRKLAVDLNISPRTYSDYETGRCRVPLDILIRLARYYNVDLNYIAGISNIRKEYPYHRKLINQWWPNYNEEMQKARDWLSKRTNEFYSQIGSYYKLGTAIPMQVNPQFSEAEQSGIRFSFNDVPLSKGTFDGKFFANRAVTLGGIASEESVVTGWDITRVTSSGTTTDHIDGDVCSLTMPVCQRLIVKAVIGQDTGITDAKTHTWQWTANATQLRLNRLSAGTDIQLYDLQGRLIHHVKAQSPTLSLPLPAPSTLFILKVGSEVVKIRL